MLWPSWDGEGWMNPTVGVHDAIRDALGWRQSLRNENWKQFQSLIIPLCQLSDEGIPNISSLGCHLNHAVNGVSNVLTSSHKQGGHAQHHHRCLKCKGWLPNVKLGSSETHLVMKTKDIVVNCDRVLYLEKMCKVTEELQHNGTFVKTSSSLLAPF